MRRTVFVALLLGLASAAMAISSEPVYIKSSKGASQVIQALQAVKHATPNLELDPQAQELLKAIEPFLSGLHVKAKSYKDKPVEVTPEFNGLQAAMKKIELAREHVLLQKLDELVKAVETASK